MALGDALRRFDADPEAHIAIICGNGRAFSSGADVHQRQLRDRKVAAIEAAGPEAVATGNIGCMTQIATHLQDTDSPIPVWHTMQVLNQGD